MESADKQKNPIAQKEEEILRFWKEKGIFRKSLEKPSPKGNFVFYDGPPFATGLPHFGHMLPTTMKDAIPRFRTMQGFHVERRWGWDCHGLPIENLVEKELGLATKKDIETYGVEKFNAAARASVLRYADQWKEIIPRLGRWVDMENDYRTMDSSYTESVWWSFKSLRDKELVYKGFKSMHICPRCETTLSNFEVNQGYKDITDISVYVKFELVDEPGTYFLAWTTTPWTLPGNVALAVKGDMEYVKVKHEYEGTIISSSIEDKEEKSRSVISPGEYILEKNIFWKVLNQNSPLKDLKIPFGDELKTDLVTYASNQEGFFEKHKDKVELINSSSLVGKSYKPLFDYYAKDEKLKNRENGWKVYAADFVTTEDGTGIVHIAPAFGSDDYALLEQKNLPFVQHVAMNGVFKPEVSDFAGMHVKPKSDDEKERLSADIAVLKYLQEHNTFFAKEKVTHSYPHCWRCDTPLLNYATSSWFVKVADLKEKLIKENKKVKWVPEDIRDGRFGKWLEGARDWAVSRSRYWGAPIPVWECAQCGASKFVGSVAELAEAQKPRNSFFVMRHGEAEHNVKNIATRDLEGKYNLTEKGKEETKRSAQQLKEKKIDLIVSSPIHRAKQTAEILRIELGLPAGAVVFDDGLSEVDFGDFEGKPISEYHAFFGNNRKEMMSKDVPGGENFHAVRKRTAECLYGLDGDHKGKNILIVTHSGPAWMLFSAAKLLDDGATAALHSGDWFMSPAEIKKLDFAPLPHNDNFELDLHRPYIDSIAFPCACGGAMRRVPEVFDVWYDSGSMPYAQNHYPFDSKKEFERGDLFPADFIAEGLDQTRGWFYVLMVLNAALFDRSPYKNVIVNGLILAEDGRKMSKSLKNYPDLMETVGTFGADSLRYFLVSSPAVRAEEVAFSEKGVDEVMKKIVMRLGNVVSFYDMYAKESQKPENRSESTNILDRWIIARLNETLKIMTDALERYELDRASRPIMDFVDDLSTWYIRRSRERFKSGDAKDRGFALLTTRHVLLTLAKLMAPFMPFTAEDVYRRAGGERESVHLEDWPTAATVDMDILNDMTTVRKVVSLGLEARAKANIKVRQPLSMLRVKKMAVAPERAHELALLIMDEVNVKVVSENLDGSFEGDAELDTTITPELKEEGRLRELVRVIQEMRKKAGLNPSDEITISFAGEADAERFVEKNKTALSKAVVARSVIFGDAAEPVDLDGLTLSVSISR